MLLQFTFENFACFSEESHFSMVASADEEHADHLVQIETGRKPRILRTATLYGANAHGKTKMIEALRFARSLIVDGTKSGQPIRVSPFRLDKQRLDAPSRFEFVISYESVEYTYGFLVDSERVHEEWLYARPNVQEVPYFERVTDSQEKVTVEAGFSLVGRAKKERQFIEFVAKGTRPNQLFLTEAVDRNVEKLEPLYNWFKDVLTIISATARFQPIEVRSSKEQDFVTFIGNFLKKAGTGIDSVEAVEEEWDYDKCLPGVPEDIKNKMEADVKKGRIINFMTDEGASFSICIDKSGKIVMVRLKTVHVGKDGLRVLFDFEEESAGTQRLMDILPILADIRADEKVYVIDELDRKLHPLLSRLFIESYLEQCCDERRGQLIFTTHDTHLLDLNLLRRDEIWFLQKDSEGSSKLYSLSDLKVRPDLKIEKGYLNGRFGGIPVIKPIPMFGSTKTKH
jgi:uncharacterized protein